MLKIGDRVYCKKDLVLLSVFVHDDFRFVSGKWYTVDFYVKSVGLAHVNGTRFSINKSKTADKDFENYFYTETEVRKVKLEKINKPTKFKKILRWSGK